MKTQYPSFGLGLLVGLTVLAAQAQVYVTPRLGGGQVAAEMVHIDIAYDADANQLEAWVDDSFGLPQLRPLEPGLAFEPEAAFAVLNGKAYNAQYGWNVGGFFTIPAGAAIWIEQTDCSPGLEVYESWGRTGSHSPIFGTAGSPRLWRWSGVMVHNTYAILDPTVDRLFAEYHIYFADADTGSREGYLELDDDQVRLEWTVVPVEVPFRFGALDTAVNAPLAFLNAERFTAQHEWVITLPSSDAAAPLTRFERAIPMVALPATAAAGGPSEGHASLGACIEVQLVSLSGPPAGQLSVWDPDAIGPLVTIGTGECGGTNRFPISQNDAVAGTDPCGHWPDRRFSVDQPGLYTLAFQLVDTSHNGPENHPLHAASEVYRILLQAGVTLARADWQNQTFVATFGGTIGWEFSLERRHGLEPAAQWQTVAGPLIGTNRLQWLTDPAAAGAPQGWYRLRADRK